MYEKKKFFFQLKCTKFSTGFLADDYLHWIINKRISLGNALDGMLTIMWFYSAYMYDMEYIETQINILMLKLMLLIENLLIFIQKKKFFYVHFETCVSSDWDKLG